ncbi:MAG TPA: methyltransferase domain-containing protein [Gemmatimonadaceae bacterium]|nr:methyltransferase domain-containing protein [Gemmatimonadaceae bacterium]
MSFDPDALRRDLERRFVLSTARVRCGAHDVEIAKPRSAEELIVEEDFERDERMPYWAELWPSAVVLADVVAGGGASIAPASGKARALELGCGLGLVTLAAMHAGWEVLATDWYEDALRFTAYNTWRGLGRVAATRMVDWHHLPPELGTFDLVLAADVLYEPRYAALVSNAIARTLAPRGRALLADPGRAATTRFLEESERAGLRLTRRWSRPFRSEAVSQTITIYELAPIA